MDQDIYNKKTRNWVKGNFALNTARKALCECIQDNFETFISSLTPTEDLHLEQFFKCLKANRIQQLKGLKQPNPYKGRKKTKTQLYCEHGLCCSLMGKFVDIHEENGSLCDCYQWSTVSSGYSSKDETKPKQSMTKSDKIWQITVLYMYVDRGESAEQYRGLEDLDISKVIKIMRNCSKFVTNGSSKLYEKVIGWRNKVMHSSNHNLDDEDMKKMLHHSKKLLNCLQISTTSYYITATQYLQKLEENDIYIGYESKEVKQLLEKVSHVKETAVELHNCILLRNTEGKKKSKCLLELLEQICPTGTPQMMFEPKAYKDKLKSCVEKQKEVVNSDISSSDGYNGETLLQLRDAIKQYLEDIDAVIDESETEEMTTFLGHMKKEKNTLKEEINRVGNEKMKLETTLQEQIRLRDNIDKNKKKTHRTKQLVKRTQRKAQKKQRSGSPTLIALAEFDSSDGDYKGIKEERSNHTWGERINMPDHTSQNERRANAKDNDYDGLGKPYMKQPDAEADNTMYTSSYRMSIDSEEGAKCSEPRTHHKYQEPKDQQINSGLFLKLVPPVRHEEDETISSAPARLKTQTSSKQRQDSLHIEDSNAYMSTEKSDESTLKDIAHNDKYKEACKKYVYFSKTNDIYSQWHASSFKVDGQTFSSAQQFMTYRKAVLFKDFEVADEILTCKDPGKVGEIGKKIKGFENNRWQEKCIHIAKEGNRAKFVQNSGLLKDLIATHPKILVEASVSNKTWGIGLNANSPLAWDDSTWKGKNCLGYVLTEVRDEIMIERGLIAQRGRKMYTDNLLKDTASLSKTESGGGVRSQRFESDTSEIYIYFESGIYSMRYRSNFTADGQIFWSVQQYLMFKKAELFEDNEIAKETLATADTNCLQQKGREVKGFKEDIWESHRFQIAKDGTMAKFRQNKSLRGEIVKTYPKEFVMASPTDKIWGIGLSEQDPRSRSKSTWNGKNYYGKILTEVRNML